MAATEIHIQKKKKKEEWLSESETLLDSWFLDMFFFESFQNHIFSLTFPENVTENAFM